MTVEIKLKLCARNKKERGLYYMKNLMHDIVCSDIRIAELKIERIRLSKERLQEKKPLWFNKKKLSVWKTKLNELELEEMNATKELQDAYADFEDFYN